MMTGMDFESLVSFESDLEASTRKDEEEDNDYAGEVVDSLDGAGIRSEEAARLVKPWMKFHRFELVRTADRLREIVDRGIEVGRIALDLETEGLDNRIEYDAEGRPFTVDKIVGFCLGLQGAGYYVPVRHEFDSLSTSLNVDSVVRAEAEIIRLCQAAQPVLKPGADILGAREKDFEVAPQVIIEFWHAKFDQEFLYPVTGIDVWNPHSFEDGMLMAYVLYTDDDLGLKENARDKLPPANDEHRYEMIEFSHLFPRGMKKRERKFSKLTPSEGSDVVYYGCSDGICTNLLCALLLPRVDADPRFKAFYRLEKQAAQTVRIVERPRVLINKREIDVLLGEAETELAHYETQIKQVAATLGFGDDFNPSSSAQLADLLFSPKGLDLNPKPEKTAEGQYKTDEKTIDAYVEEHAERMPVLGHIVKHRQINKVRGTYLKNLAENTDDKDQLRLNFKQTGAATGRFTAPKGDPEQGYGGIPIQGIPARDDPKKPKVAHSLRRMFISRPGYVLVKVDYASQELRIAASVSGEEKWIKEYEKEVDTGESADLHFMTAQAFFPGLTKDSPDLKMKRNAGKCVHPDTLVSALRYAPLGSIAAFPANADEFMDVVDLEVDGHPVTQTYNGGVKPLVHVVARKGIVTCTEEHRFMGADGQLVRAGDLCKGYKLSPIELPSFWAPGPGIKKFKLWRGVPEAVYKLDADLCYLAGAFLGAGVVSASSVKITHGDVERVDAFERPHLEWQNLLLDACRRVGLDAEPRRDAVYLGSRVTIRYLAALGLVVVRLGTEDGRQKNLRVPHWVLNQGPKGFLAFLGGLVDTDRAVSHQHSAIEFTTTDLVFAGQIAAMAQACGLVLSVEATYTRPYEWHYASLRFSVESSWKLRAYLRHPGKISRLGPAAVCHPELPAKNDVLMVIPAGDGPCLDITMGTSEHLYRANGMLTHNTANFALVYGGGVGAVQRATGCDEVEAARLKKAFDDSVPQFSKWVKKQHTYVKAHLGVETAFRRFIAIPDAMITAEEVNRRRREKGKPELQKFLAAKEAKKIQAACERKATNFPIQGSGADILKISLILLVREFMLRGWLKNGGDDSVRMVMTVHDEIVFEVREERVAEAVPVIVKIMESPYKLAGWRIPLIAEPDLGTSWAAKLSWHKMMKGEQELPPYLQGIEIDHSPDVIVLRSEVPSRGAQEPKVRPAAKPTPAAARTNGTNGVHPVPPQRAPAKEVEGSSALAPMRFLSVRLKMIHVDRATVCNIARACTDARIEALKNGRSDVMVPVEFLLGTGHVVYSRKQGYKVEPDELLAGLRRLNLLEAYDMKDHYD
jgi:DNA polymerase I-like protein with 3'-5' exonuclease and polymerase domains